MPIRPVLKYTDDLPENARDGKVLDNLNEEAVMELLRKGRISQGKAAELLDISRDELFDLMAAYDIPVVDMADDELVKELSKRVFKK
jgi:predicted HTH domain antitoxin